MILKIRLAVGFAAVAMSACVSERVVNEHGFKQRAVIALERMHEDLKKSYYDPELHGVDMDSGFMQAMREIDLSTTEQQRFKALSNYLLRLDDSHTYYIGGSPIGLGDFGFSYRFYGEHSFVSSVDGWSIADSVGLRKGDEIVTFAGQKLTRDNERRVLVNFLGQHPVPPLELEVRAPNGSASQLKLAQDTAALRKMSGREFRNLWSTALDSAKRSMEHQTASVFGKAFVWRLPEFEFADLSLGKIARLAGKHETLILDLRGNPGGPIDRLEEVLGFFVDKQVEVGTLHMRWDKERFVAKPKGDRFTGKLIVLVDSETGSSAEVFTRLLQLEKRATVVGDRTAGAVMASMQFSYASITVSDFVLHNGERLEKKGVMPDIVVIATPVEIAAGHDPVLAHALSTVGITLTPAQAAKVNPVK